MVDSVSIKIFRTEYKEHFESLGFTKAALSQLDDAITEVATTPDSVQSDADVSDLPLFVAEDEDIDAYDAVLNTRNAEETPSTEEQEELEDLFGDSTGPDMDTTDNIQSAEEIDNTLDDSRQMALHGQSLDNLRSLKKYAQSTKGHSAYNDMVEDVSACETEGQVCAVLMQWYSICHPIDAFNIGEEPFPGSYDCRFCGEDLNEPHHAHEHTYACAKEAATQEATRILDMASSPTVPCQFQLARKGKFILCGAVFTSHDERGEHMRSHIRYMTKRDDDGENHITCYFGGCAVNPRIGRFARDGPDFIDEQDRTVYLWSAHGITGSKAPVAEMCRICDQWLVNPAEAISHAVTHLDTVQTMIMMHGYCGVKMGRDLIPRLCPFCAHNESLPAHERIATFTREGHPKHIRGHLKSVGDSLVTCPCFPLTCTKEEEMDDLQLEAHLQITHGCLVPARIKRRSDDATPGTAGSQRVTKKVSKSTR